MRKIHDAAIITPYGLFNNGNRLQNWAVDHLLRELSFTPETLILKPDYTKSVIKERVLHAGHTVGFRGNRSKNYQRFLAFDSQIDKRRIWSKKGVNRLARNYDLFVVGSDQIWNPHQIRFGGAEYASMAPSSRIVALSASFGVTELPAEREPEVARLLARINHLSVRETSAAEIVEKLTGRTPPVLIDPTLAISSDTWARLASPDLVPDLPYTLILLLGDYDAGLRESVYEYARGKGTMPLHVYDPSTSAYQVVGPQDFLSLIMHAEYVVTDSYHALLFSLQFGTKCHVISRRGLSFSMSTRFESLTASLGISFENDSAIGAGRSVVYQDEDLRQAIRLQRTAFQDFLERSVNEITETS